MPTPGDLIAKLQGWVDDGGHPEDPPGSNLNDIVRAFVDWSGWQWMLSRQPWCDAGLCEAAHLAAGPDEVRGSWSLSKKRARMAQLRERVVLIQRIDRLASYSLVPPPELL